MSCILGIPEVQRQIIYKEKESMQCFVWVHRALNLFFKSCISNCIEHSDNRVSL